MTQRSMNKGVQMSISKSIKDVKEKSRKRNFVQSIDIAVTLQNVDLKKPENRFSEEIILPHGRGKEIAVGVIGDNLIIKAKDSAKFLIDEKKLKEMERNKKELKKIVDNCDFFITEPQFMARIGKSLGKVLGPRGKMPKPLPPQVDPTPMIKKLQSSVKISVKDNASIHFAIGTEDMKDEEIAKNFEAVMSALEKKLPNGTQSMKSVYMKTTMGPAVKISM